MTKEDFKEQVNKLFEEMKCEVQFYCFDKDHIRVGFQGNWLNQCEKFVFNFKTLKEISHLVNNENLKIVGKFPYDGGNFYELIVDNFTIKETIIDLLNEDDDLKKYDITLFSSKTNQELCEIWKISMWKVRTLRKKFVPPKPKLDFESLVKEELLKNSKNVLVKDFTDKFNNIHIINKSYIEKIAKENNIEVTFKVRGKPFFIS